LLHAPPSCACARLSEHRFQKKKKKKKRWAHSSFFQKKKKRWAHCSTPPPSCACVATDFHIVHRVWLVSHCARDLFGSHKPLLVTLSREALAHCAPQTVHRRFNFRPQIQFETPFSGMVRIKFAILAETAYEHKITPQIAKSFCRLNMFPYEIALP